MSMPASGIETNIMKFTCASFISGDTNRVYFIGTANPDVLHSHLFEYRFDTDSYSVVKSRAGERVSSQGCTGYKDGMGNRYFVNVGGFLGNRVELFNFTSNTWANLPDYPLTIRTARVLEDRGYLYVFGGKDTNMDFYMKILKLNLSNPTKDGWVLHKVLPQGIFKKESYVIPYH